MRDIGYNISASIRQPGRIGSPLRKGTGQKMTRPEHPRRRPPSRVELLSEERLHDGFMRLSRLRLRHERFAGGQTGPIEREVLIRRPAVAVLPYDAARDRVALIEQFRPGAYVDGANPWMYEIVAGMIESGEDPLATARREAEEEAGIVLGARCERICDYYPSPGGCSERLEVWCAEAELEGTGGLHGLASEEEDIRVHLLQAAEAFALLDDGRANSSPILIALLWLRLERERLRAAWRRD